MPRTARDKPIAWRNGEPLPANVLEVAARTPKDAWQQLLHQRALKDERTWFAPQLAHLPDPWGMRDAEKAAQRILQALDTGERVHIFGDFDADGVNATAVLVEGLRAAGLSITWEVPHRAQQGHGIAIDSVRTAAKRGCTVGISCDTGITCFQAATEAKKLGIHLIITDHHLPEGDRLPEAFAILNPAQKECGFADNLLCGCGVAFYLLLALWKLMRSQQRAPDYDLKTLLDRVAVATIADMMELRGVNRILVHHGLLRLRDQPSAGMAALLRLAGHDSCQRVDTEMIAFKVAPRINAAGRMEHGDLAVRLLLASDNDEAETAANEMDRLNQQRKKVERDIYREATARITPGGILAAFDPEWHPGVIGLVAGKLARRFHQPAAIGYIDDDTVHLSLRGVEGFHIRDILSACGDLLTRFGGHAGAGGCTLPKANWSPFMQRFSAAISKQAAANMVDKPPLAVDLALTIEASHIQLADRLTRFEPTGKGNPACRLLLCDCEIRNAREIGGGALSLWLASPGGATLAAIAFRPGILRETLLREKHPMLIGSLTRNDWNGRSQAQFVVEDALLP